MSNLEEKGEKSATGRTCVYVCGESEKRKKILARLSKEVREKKVERGKECAQMFM